MSEEITTKNKVWKYSILLGIAVLIFGAFWIANLTGNAVAQENNLDSQKKVFANLGITERFAGYENYQLKRQLVEMGGVLYELKDYDTNGDRKKDVRETFDLFGKNPSIPFSYMFDLNFDGEFSDDEIWMDDYEDGLNGNEKRCDLEILNANGEKI